MKQPKPTLARMYASHAQCEAEYLSLKVYPDVPGRDHDYPIEYSRLDTAEKVVDWVRHLTGKGWITTRHLSALVDVAIQLGAKTTDA